MQHSHHSADDRPAGPGGAAADAPAPPPAGTPATAGTDASPAADGVKFSPGRGYPPPGNADGADGAAAPPADHDPAAAAGDEDEAMATAAALASIFNEDASGGGGGGNTGNTPRLFGTSAPQATNGGAPTQGGGGHQQAPPSFLSLGVSAASLPNNGGVSASLPVNGGAAGGGGSGSLDEQGLQALMWAGLGAGAVAPAPRPFAVNDARLRQFQSQQRHQLSSVFDQRGQSLPKAPKRQVFGLSSSAPAPDVAGRHQQGKQWLSTPFALPGGNAAAQAAAHAGGSAVTTVERPPSGDDDDLVCAVCGQPGADCRLKRTGRPGIPGCTCSYHARCLDLARYAPPPSHAAHASASGLLNGAHAGSKRKNSDPDRSRYSRVTSCPRCSCPGSGLEIVPMSFADLDAAQRDNSARNELLGLGAGATGIGAALGDGAGGAGTGASDGGFSAYRDRPSAPQGSNQYTLTTSQCYDPAVPRTGRWTDEELAFRDVLIGQFLGGNLPLGNGVKLNDFLANMLKSKQSRLTKKMKHAKLSTKFYRIRDSGHISDPNQAREFGNLERAFVDAIPDAIEKSEVRFHMRREWRDHLVERCAVLRVEIDADAWLRSIDTMERRVALEKNRSRMVKRRALLGKALERDATDSQPGVFIDRKSSGDDLLLDGGTGKERLDSREDGDFGRFLMSLLDEPRGGGVTEPLQKKQSKAGQTVDANFRFAAPFLAGITSYLEQNDIPFEHVDIWVPASVPKELNGDSGVTPTLASMGSGSQMDLARGGSAGLGPGDAGSDSCRLCFAGSATLNSHILPLDQQRVEEAGPASRPDARRTPLTPDEVFAFGMFGDYSEKFSFSSGSGLPGRVFKSGIPAWEQGLTNAPSDQFERRGGAVQFGINTAVGLPVQSPNVGRIVLILYSKHNRNKNEALVTQMIKDIRLFNPSPRWKLVVDIKAAPQERVSTQPGHARAPSIGEGMSTLSVVPAASTVVAPSNGAGLPFHGAARMQTGEASIKASKISNIVSILSEHIPSDPTSTIVNTVMTVRMILLKPNRTPEEEQLVDTILVLFESYQSAGRTRPQILELLVRDFNFHVEHSQQVAIALHNRQVLAQQQFPQQLANFVSHGQPQQQQYGLSAVQLSGLFAAATPQANFGQPPVLNAQTMTALNQAQQQQQQQQQAAMSALSQVHQQSFLPSSSIQQRQDSSVDMN